MVPSLPRKPSWTLGWLNARLAPDTGITWSLPLVCPGSFAASRLRAVPLVSRGCFRYPSRLTASQVLMGMSSSYSSVTSCRWLASTRPCGLRRFPQNFKTLGSCYASDIAFVLGLASSSAAPSASSGHASASSVAYRISLRENITLGVGKRYENRHLME